MHFAKVFLRNKNLLLFFTLFSLAVFLPKSAFAQELEGAELSDAVANSLKRQGFAPQKSPMSSALFANFPYNITLDFPCKEQNAPSFFLIAAQEDFYENQKFFLDLLAWINVASFQFDTKVVFTAGDRQKIPGNEKMSGSEVFCKNMEGIQNSAALILSFNTKEKAQVLPGAGGKISPYYYAKLLCDSMEINSCPYSISGGVFLTLYRTKLLKSDAILHSFMSREIPALALKLSSKEELTQCQSNSVKDFFSGIDVQKNGVWSQHYIPVKVFSKRYWIEEKNIIYSVLVFIAAAMFILADFAFIFRRRTKRLVVIKRRALRSNYLIIVTALVTAFSFLLGEGIAKLFQSAGILNPMVLFVIKLAPAFFIISTFYPLELSRHSHLSTYRYEYILSISALLNIFIFSLFEISLFYLFAIECLILALSRVFKSRFSLFIFIAIFITPYLPLLYSILVFSDAQRINKLIFCGFRENLLLAFLLAPFNLLWLRILARLNSKAKNDKQKIVGYFGTSVSCFVGLALFSAVVIFSLEKLFFSNVDLPRAKARIFNSEKVEKTFAQVYDTEYYGGKIRRIEISSSQEAERFSVVVNGKKTNPVYFSIFDTVSTDKSAEFLLPDNPPKKLEVIYTPDSSSDQDIVITAYYMEKDSGGKRCFCETLIFEASGDQIKQRTGDNEL